MAIEVFPDSPSVGRSPRISFSHDLSQTDTVPVEQYIGSSSPEGMDFDFCVFRESFEQESSSADELFFNGKILPIEIKKRLAPAAAPPVSPQLPPPIPPPVYDHILDSSKSSKKIPRELSDEKQNSSKSFWRFKRSASLNCGSGYARTLCPLPILSRSNSTGSASSGKRSSSAKQSQSVSSNSNTTHQKPPLKKSHTSNYANINGIRINPVINVPPANLFGFGSFFPGGKDKNKKK